MTPEFSVIVPVYKVEEFLRPCVDSILGQSFPDFELILVDDGSPDGCPAICDEYAAADERVRVVHKPNGGLARARSTGISLARAEYICFVDSDDWVLPHWLETVRRCLEESGWPDLLIHEYHCPGSDRDIVHILAEPGYYDKARMEREIYPYMVWDRRRPYLTQQIPAYQWMRVSRRSLLLAHFVADEAYIPLYEDVATVYECMYNADSLYLCPDKLYIYRLREGSIMHHYDPEVYQKVTLCRDYLTERLLRQAPQLRVQIDGFFAEKFLHYLSLESAYGFSARQAARHLREGLAGTGLAEDISLDGLPARIRLFMRLFRCRLYLLAVIVYRLRIWLYNALSRK